jgi:hypothetical protein
MLYESLLNYRGILRGYPVELDYIETSPMPGQDCLLLGRIKNTLFP